MDKEQEEMVVAVERERTSADELVPWSAMRRTEKKQQRRFEGRNGERSFGGAGGGGKGELREE